MNPSLAANALPQSINWENLRNAIYGFHRNRSGNSEVAEDLTQETLLKVSQKLDTLKDKEKLKSWSFQIARNISNDYYRRQRESIPIDERYEAEDASPDINRLVATWLPRALERIPASDRQIITLVDIEGGSVKRAAETLGLSYSAAKSRIQRARQKIKEQLLECCALELDTRGNVIDYSVRNCDCDCS